MWSFIILLYIVFAGIPGILLYSLFNYLLNKFKSTKPSDNLALLLPFVLLVSLATINCRGRQGPDGTSGKDGINSVGGVPSPGSTIIIDENGNLVWSKTPPSLRSVLAKIYSYKASVLNIVCTADQQTWWRGTGTIISNDRILTADHVVAAAGTCYYYSGGVYVGHGGERTQLDNRDISVITEPLLEQGYKPIQVPFSTGYNPTVADVLVSMTHPGFLYDSPQLSLGYVSAPSLSPRELGEASTYWSRSFTTTDAITAQGSSGGPIFNEEGEIVAIVVGGPTDSSLEVAIVLPLEHSLEELSQ